jgi:Outer membrane protein beta-barrel domain
MLKSLTCAAVMFAATAGFAYSQETNWEVGVIGGAGFSPGMTVKNATTSASASVRPAIAVGVYGGQDMYRYWSAEAAYLYRAGDLKLSGDGQSASFGAHAHLITGDILAHFKPKGAHIRPYISIGGGIEVMEGTGQESFNQPLGSLAALTATREVLPVGEVGVGVKVRLSPHLLLRLQARDYITQAPNEVIAPAPGAKLSGPRQDVIGSVALAFTW